MAAALDADADTTLRITEIFLSLQGESTRVGLPTVFVRLTGCPLRCGYCDTAYAFTGGATRKLADVLAEVAAMGVPRVCVTGGEPLAQPGCIPLLRLLADAGYDLSLETSGALSIAAVDERVARVVDLKTPGSGESARNLYANLPLLTERDEVKFVLCDRADYEWARLTCTTRGLFDGPATVLFSPVADGLQAAQLAEWIIEDRLPVRFQLQLHKVLWDDAPGR